jgi:hypothetical protein
VNVNWGKVKAIWDSEPLKVKAICMKVIDIWPKVKAFLANGETADGLKT